jgi:hypothetical protein
MPSKPLRQHLYRRRVFNELIVNIRIFTAGGMFFIKDPKSANNDDRKKFRSNDPSATETQRMKFRRLDLLSNNAKKRIRDEIRFHYFIAIQPGELLTADESIDAPFNPAPKFTSEIKCSTRNR